MHENMAGQSLSEAKQDTLWTVKSCAKFLGKSVRWVYSALTNAPEQPGSIPHVRVGGSIRFFPADVQSWVREGCPPAATFAEWQAAHSRRIRHA